MTSRASRTKADLEAELKESGVRIARLKQINEGLMKEVYHRDNRIHVLAQETTDKSAQLEALSAEWSAKENQLYRAELVSSRLSGALSGIGMGSLLPASLNLFSAYTAPEAAVVYLFSSIIGIAGGGIIGSAISKKERTGAKWGLSFGLTASVVSTTLLLGAQNVGYDGASPSEIRQFETPKDRGLMLKLNDGTQLPYVLTEEGYKPFGEFRDQNLGALSENQQTERQTTESNYSQRLDAIYQSLEAPKPKDKEPQSPEN